MKTSIIALALALGSAGFAAHWEDRARPAWVFLTYNCTQPDRSVMRVPGRGLVITRAFVKYRECLRNESRNQMRAIFRWF